MQLPDLKGVRNASENLQGVSVLTPLVINERLSNDLNCKIYLKREDLQQVRSFKIRGAFNKIRSIDSDYLKNKTLVCASAGNHAQGVASACKKLKIKCLIVMPKTTPEIKIRAVKNFGARVKLFGDNYDQAVKHAYEICKKEKKEFIHPFDDPYTIAGQGTVGKEILETNDDLDAIFVPVGGGGLLAGVSAWIAQNNKKIKIYYDILIKIKNDRKIN